MIISLFETVKLSVSISPRSLYNSLKSIKESRLSLSRLRLSRITAYLEKKIRSLFKHRNLTSGNKILLTTIFSIYMYIYNLRSPTAYSFVKFGCAICIFLNSENLICRSADISKCFKGSFQHRDNEG